MRQLILILELRPAFIGKHAVVMFARASLGFLEGVISFSEVEVWRSDRCLRHEHHRPHHLERSKIKSSLNCRSHVTSYDKRDISRGNASVVPVAAGWAVGIARSLCRVQSSCSIDADVNLQRLNVDRAMHLGRDDRTAVGRPNILGCQSRSNR